MLYRQHLQPALSEHSRIGGVRQDTCRKLYAFYRHLINYNLNVNCFMMVVSLDSLGALMIWDARVDIPH